MSTRVIINMVSRLVVQLSVYESVLGQLLTQFFVLVLGQFFAQFLLSFYSVLAKLVTQLST